MSSYRSSDLKDFASRGELVVMAGAGVSAGKPSALPAWYAIDAAIAQVLCRRVWSLSSPAGGDGRLVPLGPFLVDGVDLMTVVDAKRTAGRFPPDYQAQLIEEMCGDRYFRALQALDVDTINAGHDGIAALAAAGALKAVVTTNFDRLIERALDKRGVNHVVAKDDVGYVEMLQHLTRRKHGPLPVLKIHGSVTDHLSMIDTLKQRKRGRSQRLEACLNALQSHYWLYIGFSAADLETDKSYLGLVAGAARSAGATYVAYPRNADLGKQTRICGKNERKEILGKGAQLLMDAYGDRGEVVEVYVATFLGEACRALGKPGPDPIPEDASLGLAQFQTQLEDWARNLTGAAAGLCLGAILEAIGQAELAVRILDFLARKDGLYEERGTSDFRALQLHYGRLGSAWGRFVAVRDMGGAASNASVETTQSLLRLKGSELEFAANGWLACVWLWLGYGQPATATAAGLLKGFLEGEWKGAKPRSDEETVDAWLSAAQVCILNSHEETLSWILGTAGAALDRAERCGDVVRAARVTALKALALAETTEDVRAILAKHEADFGDAERVGDGVALGMRALAVGRWYAFLNGLVNGLAIAGLADRATVAQRSLGLLNDAMGHFRNQGMDPWQLYVSLQFLKVLADLHQFDDVQLCINNCIKGLERFPILASHFHDAVGQVQTMVGDVNAAKSFRAAVQAANESGLLARFETLTREMQLRGIRT